MGGLLKIWAVPPTEITINDTAVSFTTTNNIVEMYCSSGSMSVTEEESNGKPGISFKTEINGFTPKDTAEAQQMIADMTGRKWVVIYLDQNEQYKVAGTVAIPLRVAFDLGTGSDTPERNGHSVSFYGTQVSRAKFISNPFAE